MRTAPLLLSLTLFGCTSESPRTTSPADPSLHLEITGDPTYFGWTGVAVGRLGDVNGDGKDDLLVVARGPAEGGRAAVFFGPLARADRAIGGADFVVEAGWDYTALGNDVEHAGGCDVDGDGIADILLGAPYGDRDDVSAMVGVSGDNAGRAVLIRGRRGLAGKIAPADADAIFVGESPYGLAGTAIACLGDLDGDGKGDFAIGAPRATRGGVSGRGAVYLFYGGPRSGRVDLATDADAVFVGSSAYEQAGRTVAPVGDVDGDGHPDFVVAAPNATGPAKASGGAYLVRSAHERFSGTIDLATQTKLEVPADALRMGWRVQGLGDHDGDGLSDVALGGYPSPTAMDATGRVLVYLGRRAMGATLASAFTIRGGAPGDAVGVGLAGGRDLDGDGLGDLLVGGPDVGGKGALYVVRGTRAPHDVVLDASAGAASWRVFGDEPGAWLGENVVFVGDLDGDGTASDFLISARGVTRGPKRAGAVMLYTVRKDRP